MILGDTCTRRCGFCNVKTGKPTWNDPLEPLRVARSVAQAWACATRSSRASTATTCPTTARSALVGVIRSIRMQAPGCKIECLTPDFRGEEMPLAKVIAERPDVFNHNVEVVAAAVPGRAPRLALGALAARAAQRAGDGRAARSSTKSGLMVGLGETHEEMVDAFGAAARARASRSSPSASTCARPSATCRSCATGSPTSSRRSRPPPTRSASSTSPPARSCARATTPTSTSSRIAAGRRPARRRRGLSYVARVPAPDNIPTERFPVVTIALIVGERPRLLLLAAGRDLARRPEQRALHLPTWCDYAAIPYEITHPGDAVSPIAHAAAATPTTRRPYADRRSPRCSCTAACCTSAATCCSCGSSATTSRTPWARSSSSSSTCSAGSRRRRAQIARRTRTRRCPTLGASGAIAGVLGGYLLLFPRARVVTVIFIIFFFTILELPALLVLGFWFVQQALFGYFDLAAAGRGRRRRVLRAHRRLRVRAAADPRCSPARNGARRQLERAGIGMRSGDRRRRAGVRAASSAS